MTTPLSPGLQSAETNQLTKAVSPLRSAPALQDAAAPSPRQAQSRRRRRHDETIHLHSLLNYGMLRAPRADSRFHGYSTIPSTTRSPARTLPAVASTAPRHTLAPRLTSHFSRSDRQSRFHEHQISPSAFAILFVLNVLCVLHSRSYAARGGKYPSYSLRNINVYQTLD
jgi:hypothetical protein